MLQSGARFVLNHGDSSEADTPTTVEKSASSSHLTWRTVWLLAQTLDDNQLQLHKCWFGMGCRREKEWKQTMRWRGGV